MMSTSVQFDENLNRAVYHIVEARNMFTNSTVQCAMCIRECIRYITANCTMVLKSIVFLKKAPKLNK